MNVCSGAIINLPTELQFSLLSREEEVLEEEPMPVCTSAFYYLSIRRAIVVSEIELL
jgi:hypothetical protein